MGWRRPSGHERPVVSAGQYGTFLNQLIFTVDPATGEVQAKTQNVLNLKGRPTPFPANYPATAATRRSWTPRSPRPTCWVRSSWARSVRPFNRAKFANGTTENRGGESTLGNLVAEVQRWATRSLRPAPPRSPS